MDRPAFTTPIPLGQTRNVSGPFRAPHHHAVVCVAPNRSRRPAPAKKRPFRSGGSRKQSGPPGPGRPRLDLGEAERLQKVMSRLGVASRRRSEELIAEGKVYVNGRVVRNQGTLVNLRKDRIKVQGKEVVAQESAVWVAVHKPKGYLSLPREGSKKSVADLLPRSKRNGLITVGGIDEDYSGIVIMTNERGHVPELSSPQNPHVKEWIVDCDGLVKDDTVEPLRRGAKLKGNSSSILPADIKILGSEKVEQGGEKKLLTRMEVRVRDSRRHLISRLFESVGLTVVRASRRGFGPILLSSLKRGDFRYLTPNEVKALTRGVKRDGK